MQTKVEQSKTTSKRLSLKQIKEDRKKLDYNPVGISKFLKKNYSHVILHKEKNRFSFTVFWWNDDNMPCEPVARAIKSYKTKQECIKAIKKLGDASPKISRGFACYDYNLDSVDCEIKYDVKRLL